MTDFDMTAEEERARKEKLDAAFQLATDTIRDLERLADQFHQLTIRRVWLPDSHEEWYEEHLVGDHKLHRKAEKHREKLCNTLYLLAAEVRRHRARLIDPDEATEQT